jgi:hypothetical protein
LGAQPHEASARVPLGAFDLLRFSAVLAALALTGGDIERRSWNMMCAAMFFSMAVQVFFLPSLAGWIKKVQGPH